MLVFIKHYVLLRSENALGTILLNIMVESARVDKVGDNNILLATVPNPPIPGMVKMLKERFNSKYAHSK